MRVLLVLLLLPLVAAGPNDNHQIDEVPPRFPVSGFVASGTAHGLSLDAELGPGTLISVSAQNHGPGVALFTLYEGSGDVHAWQVAPNRVHTEAWRIASDPAIYVEVTALGDDVTVALFADVADCVAPCAKAPAKEVPGATLFELNSKKTGTLLAQMHWSLPITGISVLDKDGGLLQRSATSAIGYSGTGQYLLVEHGNINQAAYGQLLQQGGVLEVGVRIEPGADTPFPAAMVLLALAFAVMRARRPRRM